MNPQHDHVCYADQAWHGESHVIQNTQIARDTFRLRVPCPELAAQVVPGQFVMVRPGRSNDPLLGRALAVYDVIPDAEGQPEAIDLVYLVVGRGTRRLSELQMGDFLEVWGPLGNGFSPEPAEHLVIAAGGIGQTPFLILAKEYAGVDVYGNPPRSVPKAKKISFCYGARTHDLLAGLNDFRRLDIDVHISTDDGSYGRRGLVTDLVREVIADSPEKCRIVACGPDAMLRAVGLLAAEKKVPCELSLETGMACGIGICFSCVARIRDSAGGWDYRRTCVEGPVFPAVDVVFD